MAQKVGLDEGRLREYVDDRLRVGLPPIFGKLGLTEKPDMPALYAEMGVDPKEISFNDKAVRGDVDRALLCAAAVDVKNGDRRLGLTHVMWEVLEAASSRSRGDLVAGLSAVEGMMVYEPKLFESSLRKVHAVMKHGG